MSFFRDLLIERKRKPYYCEVEYLESTGTQWIDTGFVPTSDNFKYEGNMQASVGWFFGYRSVSSGTTTGDMRAMFVYPDGRMAIRYGAVADNSTLTIDSNKVYKVFFDGTSIYVNDINYVSVTGRYSSPVYRSMYLFSANATGYYSGDMTMLNGKIYNWKIWDGNTLVRDFIPVLNFSLIPCMYDKVTRKLFYNQGTGSFSYGREIHPVEYIEAENGGGSTIVEYAVGNYRLTNTTDWEITFSASNSNNSWVMGQPTWIGVHYRKDTTTSNLPRVGITNGSTTATQCYVDYTDNEKITLALKGTDVYANGVKAGSITRASAGATQTEYGIFAYKDISQELPNLRIQSARIYRLKIWDNGVLVQDLIPAIDEKGVGGFFENVSRTFIDKESNSNSEFSYPPVELEYLESTGTQYIDTGYAINTSTDEVVSDFQLISTTLYQWIMGEHDNGARFGIGVGDGTNKRNIAYGANTYKVQDAQVYNEKHNFKANSSGVFLDDVQIHGYENFASASTVYLFKLNLSGSNGAAGKIWYYKHKRNGTLVRDLIPCFQNGVAGMWDKVNSVFYPNAGTGSFATGKIIESRWF